LTTSQWAWSLRRNADAIELADRRASRDVELCLRGQL
jgi:hypothetical protein